MTEFIQLTNLSGYIDRIEEMGACREFIRWLRREAHPDLAAAWAACPRAEWLLWLAGRYCAISGGPEQYAIVGAGAECAAAVSDLIEYKNRDAHYTGRDFHTVLEATRRWARGKATSEEMRNAANVACRADRTFLLPARLAALAAHKAACAARQGAYLSVAWYAAKAAELARKAASDDGRTIDFAAIVRQHIPNPLPLPERR